MKQIRKRITYANVMSSLAVFLVLGGATALAAGLARNSVGSKQLKRNAVTSAKIKRNAITTAKIKNNAVTGAKIKASSTPFSQIVYEARGNSAVALPTGGGGLYPLSNASYTQAANRDDSYIGALDVTFQPGCTAPRTITAYVLVDPANPSVPTINDVAAAGQFQDTAGGTVSQRVNMSQYISGGIRFQQSTPAKHTLYIATQVSCTAGSGVQATSGGVDVIGTKAQ